MKKVLIISNKPVFSEFLKQKLSADQIEVILAQAGRDAYPKLMNSLPNLILLDMEEDNFDEMEFLEKKSNEPNTAPIPVILSGPTIEKSIVTGYAKFGVIKYFKKPVQFDIYFESIGRVLNIPLSMDDTPCVLDLHRNNKLVFIEIAKGLNREKISLLKFKLSELIENAKIDTPKIIVMLTNLDLSFVDGYNIEYLLDIIISCDKVLPKNVKVLSLSPFVNALVKGHNKYSGMEVTQNLSQVLNSVVESSFSMNVSDIISEAVLTSTNSENEDEDAVDTRFSSDAVNPSDATKNDGTFLNIAVIDSTDESCRQTMAIFSSIGAHCIGYKSGQEFMSSYKDDEFDLIILDVSMSDYSGFQVLQSMHENPKSPSIVVYSPALSKEVIAKVLNAGVKAYVIKPQKPHILIQKALSVLRTE